MRSMTVEAADVELNEKDSMVDVSQGRRAPVTTESGAERIARREARRQENQAEAFKAAKSAHKGDVPPEERLAQAAAKLDGTNVGQAIGLIREARPEEQDWLLLAEERGKARKQVLTSFPKPRAQARKALEDSTPS